MTVLGADPDQLEATAARVLARADDYDDACNQIGHWLRRMDWQGPEADRFHATFESQMRPQLGAAAAFLRQAAAELRAQATAQTKASQTPEVVGSALAASIELIASEVFSDINEFVSEVQFESWLEGTIQWMDKLFPTPTGPFGGLPDDLPSIRTIAGLVGMGSDFVGFGSLAYLRHMNKLPEFGKRLPKFGLERIIGGPAGSAVGGAMAGFGVGMGIFNLPDNVNELGNAWDKMHESRYIQPEAMGDFLDAGADYILSGAAIAGGFYTPVGLGLSAFGYGMKLGANLDTPIIWACDNIIYPAWDAGTDFAGDVWDAGTDFAGDVWDAGTDFAGDVWDAGTDFAGDVWDTAGDVAGAVGGFFSNINPF